MIMAKCDVCGTGEETSRVTVQAPVPLPIFRETPVPDGWRRVQVPMPDGSAWKREICPECLKRLWDLFGIPYDRTGPTRCVRCGHAPSTHGRASYCGVLVGGRVCGCDLSPSESTDEGWARPVDPDAHDFGGGSGECTGADCNVSWGEVRSARTERG